MAVQMMGLMLIKKSGTHLVLNACNNLYWFSSIFSFGDSSNLCFIYFFKVSAEPSSHKDQSGDKSKGASSKDDDKGAKDDDKAAKDDDKASKDDVSIRDDGKQGKNMFFISPAAIFVSVIFWLNQQLGLSYLATYDFA